MFTLNEKDRQLLSPSHKLDDKKKILEKYIQNSNNYANNCRTPRKRIDNSTLEMKRLPKKLPGKDNIIFKDIEIREKINNNLDTQAQEVLYSIDTNESSYIKEKPKKIISMKDIFQNNDEFNSLFIYIDLCF